MKKSTKTALIASAVVLSACIGTLALVGCGEKKVDPYANMTPTCFSDLNDYVTSKDSDMSFIGVNVEYRQTVGKRHENFDLQSRTTTQGQFAHCYIDCVVPAGNTILEIKGNVWLQNNRLYIDNGTDKYWVEYSGSTYENSELVNLTKESQIFSKYFAIALSESQVPTKQYLSSALEANLKDSIIYKATNESDVYYKVDYKNGTTSSTLKLHFKNFGINEYESAYTMQDEDGLKNQSIKISQLSGDITRPGKDEDWKKGE